MRELAHEIVSVFEDLLDEHGIMIPDSDRTGAKGEAPIYGCTYGNLVDEIEDLLGRYKLIRMVESAKNNTTKTLYVVTVVDGRGNRNEVCYTFDLFVAREAISNEKIRASRWELERAGYFIEGWKIVSGFVDPVLAYHAWADQMFDKLGALPPADYFEDCNEPA